MSKKYDIAVIGAGPGGYVAAIRAAQLGFKAVVIEKSHLGGICLNWGCIPTKALLRSAEVYHLMQHSEEFGINCENINIDFEKLINRSRDVAGKLSAGIRHLLKKNKVDVIEGHARFIDSNKLAVEAENTIELTADHIIIATGASPKSLPGLEPDGEFIWNYKDAMVPKTLPKSMLVIGSGAIGIEFASFYRMLGCEVSVVEISDRIMTAEDKEISQFMYDALKDRGINIHTNSKVINVDKKSHSAIIQAADATELNVQVDKIISAVGVTANINDLGLGNTKVSLEKGHIKADEFLKTEDNNIYAIGDVISPPWLAHKASHEAILCIEKIAGIKDVRPIDARNIPGCTYSYPQVASVGLTETKAKEEGYQIKVGRFPFIGNGKAIALGEEKGFVKTIFNTKTGELLGAHMVGAEVTEMIQGYVNVKQLEGTELDIMHTIYPHPTLSEVMHESALSAYNKAIHI